MRTRIAAVLSAAVLAGGCQHTEEVAPTSRITNPNVSYPSNYHAPESEPAVTAKAHYAAGQLAESQCNLDKAVEQYRLAVRLDPSHVEALYRLGMILTAERKPDAPAVWQQYVTVTGGTASAYSDLGFSLDLADRPADAERAFRAGIAQDPKCEPCRVNYARLLARRGDLDAAAAQLSAVLTPAEVQFDMGAIFEAEGDPQAAAARYRKALDLDPQLSDASVRLAAMN